MVKLNIKCSTDYTNAKLDDQKAIKIKKIKKIQKHCDKTVENNQNDFSVFSKQKSILEIFSTIEIPKKLALNKSYLFQTNQNEQKLNLELGPSFEDLLKIGVKFTQKEIFGIGKKLIKTIKFLNIHNKISGGIFPKNIRCSKDLTQYYLIDMSRCKDMDIEAQSMKYYEKSANQNFVEHARLFGSQNLIQNFIPSQRDEIQNILNILYYFECILNQKIYKKSEIGSSHNLKELYYIIKQFKYNQKIMIDPIITYFTSREKSLEIDDSFFQRIQITKLNSFLVGNPEKYSSFEIIIKKLKCKSENPKQAFKYYEF